MSTLPPPEERRRLADLVGVNAASLYQALTGRGTPFKPSKCVSIERDSGGALRRWQLRPNDWWENWPELVGSEGAPPVPTEPVKQPA